MRLLLPLLFTLACFASFSHAQQAPYQEGIHYIELEQPVPVKADGQVQVVEVFWYGCSHCFRFEPLINQWKEDLPDDVTFEQVPAMWNRLMETHARMFYAAEKLGILDNVHQAFFNAMHVHGKPLDKAEAIGSLMAEYGAEKEVAIEALSDVDVVEKVQAANQLARKYQITGTPQMIVQGRYRVESNRDISQADMLDIVDYLVAREKTSQ